MRRLRSILSWPAQVLRDLRAMARFYDSLYHTERSDPDNWEDTDEHEHLGRAWCECASRRCFVIDEGGGHGPGPMGSKCRMLDR